jgi:hypothetical protein
VDHLGVPNSTLVNEVASLAISYKRKSVAEQNSVDLACDLFMDPEYEGLKRVLYINKTKFQRSKQLVTSDGNIYYGQRTWLFP